MAQGTIFLKGEGDHWFRRNTGVESPSISTLGPMLDLVEDCDSVLELGCADARNAPVFHQRFPDAKYFGLDPSSEAIQAAKTSWPAGEYRVGLATDLDQFQRRFSLIYCGFFLYLQDREELFLLMHKIHNALDDGGHLLIYDFSPAFPHVNTYHHHDGVLAHKLQYGKLFEASGLYHTVAQQRFDTRTRRPSSDMNSQVGTHLLRKLSMADGFLTDPYKATK
jgi:SAM-dependent methyltransferase